MYVMNHNQDDIFGVSIGNGDLATVTADSVSAILSSEQKQIVFACANPHSLVVSQQDDVFHTALKGADYLVADGTGVVFISRLLGIDVGPRITGWDYFYSVMTALENTGHGRI